MWGSWGRELASGAVWGGGKGACVGGLQRALEDGDGVVLGCDVAEGFGAAGGGWVSSWSLNGSWGSSLFLNPWLEAVVLFWRGRL
jgi:hypothetical protein